VSEQDGRTAVYHAAWKGYVEAIKVLIREGNCNVDIQQNVRRLAYTLFSFFCAVQRSSLTTYIVHLL